MATGTYAPDPAFTGFDDNGDPLNGGLLYTYAAGTSTPLATYSDVSLTTPNANPVVLDSAGRCTLFLSATSYKFILKNAAGTTIWTRDNIGAVPATNIDNDVTGTAGEALTAGQVAYLSDGSGSLTSGRWYKADADLPYASVIPVLAFVVADITAGAEGTFRLSGRVTGLSGLTPGANYYVSATAGSVTAAAPANVRFVGRADSITSMIVAPNPIPQSGSHPCEGRLTLTSGTAVTTADVTAATTLYFTPYQGDRIDLFDGSAWYVRGFTQISIAVPATTNQMYDVFVYDNAGTLTLELTAWTNDTTRATALTTQNGVLVKTGALTRRYVGSFRTTGASGQTEDSLAKRFVWNYYNRVGRPLRYLASSSHTYTTTTFRQWDNSTSAQLAHVVGVIEDNVNVVAAAHAYNTDTGVANSIGIGASSTTTPATGSMVGSVATAIASGTNVIPASYMGLPSLGYQTWVLLERGGGTGTTTWEGASSPNIQSGLWGSVQG